ncbi:hypothetical protein U1Q18_009624 [Sarracenia purpurea var. burkii]
MLRLQNSPQVHKSNNTNSSHHNLITKLLFRSTIFKTIHGYCYKTEGRLRLRNSPQVHKSNNTDTSQHTLITARVAHFDYGKGMYSIGNSNQAKPRPRDQRQKQKTTTEGASTAAPETEYCYYA